jgi:tetratricopeptide (TPR) repeat protein
MPLKQTNFLGPAILALSLFILGACSHQPSEITTAVAAEGVPEDAEIAKAMALIERSPDLPLAHDQLAIVYIKKARLTGDFDLNAKAEAAVRKALEIDPNHAPSRKLLASLHLTMHRFSEGLELGDQLRKEFPNDAFVYGVLTDANAELGNYPEAIAMAQKMVDLKPNSNSYARVAHMRSLHGDHAGAVEAYKLAARTADPSDKEAQSWCLVQLGKELWNNGKYAESVKVYDEALGLLPEYSPAILAKARSLASLSDYDGAARVLSALKDGESDPDLNILLAHIHARRGEAQKSEEFFRRGESAEAENLGVAGEQGHLAMLWADHDMNLAKALEIAESEFSRQKDIYTADLLSWCLYKNGKFEEAQKISQKAVSLKTNDARLYYHAGMIEAALGNKPAARALLEKALRLNPQFDLKQADVARETIGKLRG